MYVYNYMQNNYDVCTILIVHCIIAYIQECHLGMGNILIIVIIVIKISCDNHIV